MPRKATARAVAPATSPILVPPPESASSVIVERKRARRAPTPVVANDTAPAVVAIDLATMTAENAKKALFAAYPRQREGSTINATEATTEAALTYLNARDAVTIAEGRKDAAGNVLRFTMGTTETIVGDGWEATWKEQKSEIDWGALAKELAIPSATIERHRKAPKRVLNVREKAK